MVVGIRITAFSGPPDTLPSYHGQVQGQAPKNCSAGKLANRLSEILHVGLPQGA